MRCAITVGSQGMYREIVLVHLRELEKHQANQPEDVFTIATPNAGFSWDVVEDKEQ